MEGIKATKAENRAMGGKIGWARWDVNCLAMKISEIASINCGLTFKTAPYRELIKALIEFRENFPFRAKILSIF